MTPTARRPLGRAVRARLRVSAVRTAAVRAAAVRAAAIRAFAVLGAVALAASSAACVSADPLPTPPPWPRLEAAELAALSNCFRCGDLYLGGVPGPAELDLAERRGVRTIVDLRGDVGPGDPLGAAIGQLPFVHVRVGLPDGELGEAQVDRLLAELRRDDRGLTLLFSATGHRAAAVFGVWRAVDQGLPVDTAIQEAKRAGLKPGESEAWIRAQVERLLPPSAR